MYLKTLTENTKKVWDKIRKFDNLKDFYKTCTKEYAEKNSQRITQIYKKLCQLMQQKKS